MADTSLSDQIATEIYNRVLGNKTGRPRSVQSHASFQIDPVGLALYRSILQKASDAEKVRKSLSSKSGGSSKSKSSSKKTPAEIEAQKKQLIKDSNIHSGEHKGFFDQIGSAVGKGLELASRPSSAVNSALKNIVEARYKGNEPWYSTLDNALYGARRGITGKEHTGFGDVLHSYTTDIQQPITSISPAQQKAIVDAGTFKKDWVDQLEKWSNRGTGLIGDIATDPLTYLSLGTETAAKEAAAGVARATGREAVSSVAKNAASDALESIGKKAYEGKVGSRIEDAVNRSTRQVSHGPNAEKVIGSKETYNQIGREAGVATQEASGKTALDNLENFYKNLGTSRAWSASKIAAKRRNPLFALAQDVADKVRVAGGSVDDAILAGKRAVREATQGEADTVAKAVTDALHAGVKKNVTVRFMGKKIGNVPGVADAASKIGSKLTDTALGRVHFSFSHARQNPGLSAVLASKAKASIVNDAEKFSSHLEQISSLLKPGEANILTDMLEGTVTGPAHLQPVADHLRKIYDQIFKEGVDAGVRSAKDKVENYTYQRLKRIGKNASQWSEQRKIAIREDALKGGKAVKSKAFTTQLAKDAKLRPNQDALVNLQSYYQRSLQKTAPHRLSKMLGDAYSVNMTLPTEIKARDKFLAERNLKLIPTNEYSDLAVKTLKAGETPVMDRDLYDIVKRYREMVKPGSLENRDLIRIYDLVLGKFKKMATIYRPGFHLKNVISDAFLGSMDGISPADYEKVFAKLEKGGGGQALGSHNWNELADIYHKNLSSGFIGEENLGSQAVRRRVAKRVQDLSEHREDWGRFAHFYGALKDEYRINLAKGIPEERAWKEAVDTSIYRVNKYKFDYGALTKTEAKVMRRIIPFYTFSRKVIPLLAESAFISPRNLAIASRLIQEGNQQLPQDTPDWMKQAGFIPFTEGNRPWGATLGQILPINNATELADNPLANMSPIATLPLDLYTGHDIFSHKAITGSNPGAQFFDALKNKLPPVQAYRQAFPGRIQGDNSSSITPLIQRASNLLGVPVRQVTDAQANQQLRAMVVNLSNQVKVLNKKANEQGYSIYYSERSDGVSIRIRDDSTGEVMGEFDSLPEAKAALAKILR